MKNSYTLFRLFLTLLIPAYLNAQDNYHKVKLHLKNDKTQEIFIEIDFKRPQRLQQGIPYMTPKNFEKYSKTAKLKGKMKQEMEPKHFTTFTLYDGRIFKTVLSVIPCLVLYFFGL